VFGQNTIEERSIFTPTSLGTSGHLSSKISAKGTGGDKKRKDLLRARLRYFDERDRRLDAEDELHYALRQQSRLKLEIAQMRRSIIHYEKVLTWVLKNVQVDIPFELPTPIMAARNKRSSNNRVNSIRSKVQPPNSAVATPSITISPKVPKSRPWKRFRRRIRRFWVS
jgi:hypothetical protein